MNYFTFIHFEHKWLYKTRLHINYDVQYFQHFGTPIFFIQVIFVFGQHPVSLILDLSTIPSIHEHFHLKHKDQCHWKSLEIKSFIFQTPSSQLREVFKQLDGWRDLQASSLAREQKKMRRTSRSLSHQDPPTSW